MFEVIKIAKSGKLVWSKILETTEDIAKELKCSAEIITQIQQKVRFPKGKTCVFNKYSIREIKAVPTKESTIYFT
jgi:hypothetical protein